MKQIFTLITVLITAFSANAQSDENTRHPYKYQGVLSVSYVINDRVWILVDGSYYNAKENDDEMMTNYIRPGYHSIKVYRQKRAGNNIEWIQGRKKQLVYEGNIFVKPGYHVDLLINRFGKVFIDERQLNTGYYEGHHNEWQPGWDSPDDHSIQPMNSHGFEQFKQVIINERFENTKLVLAKQTISSNYFSSAQVKEIMQLFSFENNKLDIAEYSYKYTLDKKNYFILNDAFTFSGSKEELARFIKAYR